MGLTKTILFGSDPAHDEIRIAWRDATAERKAAHPFPIRTRRKNRIGRCSYWDPFWPSAVATALSELGIEAIIVNGRYCVRTREHAQDALRQAKAIHAAKCAKWSKRNLK